METKKKALKDFNKFKELYNKDKIEYDGALFKHLPGSSLFTDYFKESKKFGNFFIKNYSEETNADVKNYIVETRKILGQINSTLNPVTKENPDKIF